MVPVPPSQGSGGRTVAAPAWSTLVDVGGGLGIPYEAHEDSLDLVGLARRLAELDESWRNAPSLGGMHVLIEPGRFLVGPAGAYLARVVDVKGLDGTCVAILGLSESPLLFLSHGVPAEVAVKGGRAELIRPRLDPGELLRLQRQPLW